MSEMIAGVSIGQQANTLHIVARHRQRGSFDEKKVSNKEEAISKNKLAKSIFVLLAPLSFPSACSRYHAVLPKARSLPPHIFLHRFQGQNLAH